MMVNSAPLHFDHSLRRRNGVLREENVQERCQSTLNNSSDSWITSAQCYKGAKLQKRRSSKEVYSLVRRSWKRGRHVVCIGISFVTGQLQKNS